MTITATNLRAYLHLWIQGMRVVAEVHLPALLATDNPRAQTSSCQLASHPPILQRGTMQPSRTPLPMILRASSRTPRPDPGAPSSQLTKNGTVSVVTRGAARSLLGATPSDDLPMLARTRQVALDPGSLLDRDLLPRQTPSTLSLLRREVGQER